MGWFNSRQYRIQDRIKTEEHTLAGFWFGFTALLAKAEMAE